MAAAFEDAGIQRRVPALPFNGTYALPQELANEEAPSAIEASAGQPEGALTKQDAEQVAEQPATQSAKQAADQPQRIKKAKRRPRGSVAAEQAKPAAEAEDRWTGIVCTGSLC